VRTHHICPKCGGDALVVVRDVLSRPLLAPAGRDAATLTFEAYVCEACRYSEIYATAPTPVDGTVVQPVPAPDDALDPYDDWLPPEDPEPDDFLEPAWGGEDAEVTEVSRVEKRPESRFGAKVILTDLGTRPAGVIDILCGTLGLSIPGEAWLRSALPFVVLDLVSNDAAHGLERLLREAGGSAEVQPRESP
jgi:hypothetical protein